MLLVDEVLSRIRPGDRVLDVGGWACPFNRADWVLDREPYATRGYSRTIGLPASQGGETEHVTEQTRAQRDICDHTSWPFPDKFFDFAICSHTLEDIRDPLFVCRELIRVVKRGYIETPSRLAETCRGGESPHIAGLSHHRWLIEYSPSGLDFWPKYHMIHANPRHNLPPWVYENLTETERVSWLFWDDSFSVEECGLHGLAIRSKFLSDFVDGVLESDRFRQLAPPTVPEPTPAPAARDEIAQLRDELQATRLRLDEAHQKLHAFNDLGPIGLGVARRLRRASRAFPHLVRAVKPVLRAAKSVVG
jgi:SAM-dependent methyltransferase